MEQVVPALRGRPSGQVMDGSISRTKYVREVERFRQHEEVFRRRGCLLLEAEYPTVELLIGAPHLRPWAALYGVRIDFTNYDALPPSVRLINPWTRELLRSAEVTAPMTQFKPGEKQGDANPGYLPHGQLVQWQQPPYDIPFICTQGIREYHDHPAHTGDSWWLHRGTGRGTLISIIDMFVTHASSGIADYAIQIQALAPSTQLTALRVVQAKLGFYVRAPDGTVLGAAF